MAMTANPCESENDRRTECSQLTAGTGGNGTRSSSDRGLIATTISLNVLTRSVLVRPRAVIPKRNL